MKIKNFLFLTALFTSLFLANQLNATHMMGGDITYKWLGAQKYEFSFKVYRDCRGIPFNSPDIKLGGISSGSLVNEVSVNYTRTSIIDLTQMCSDTLTKPCYPANSTANMGVEQHTFTAIIDFSTTPYKYFVDNGFCQIHVKLEQCCRNGAITTITPGNFYMETVMNICNSNFENSSPQFFNVGNLSLACNQAFKSNFGAFDLIDNDSITYELVNPLNAYNTNESYSGNFNPNYPLTPYCPPNPGVLNCKPLPNSKPPRGFYFDKKNGDMVFTPTKCDEVAVITIKVSEFRKINGQWKNLGYVMRDIQLFTIVASSEIVVPEMTVNDEYSFKTREETCFDIVTFDTINSLTQNNNRGDVTRISILNQPSGSSLSYLDSSKNSKTGRFCWTVHDSVYHQINNISKTIPMTIEVIDNYCPKPSVIRKTVFLRILTPDSTGHILAKTYIDKNKNLSFDNQDKAVGVKVLVKNQNTSYSIQSDANGDFADEFRKGDYTFGGIQDPYLKVLKPDTNLTIEMDSSYTLDFPVFKRNGIYGRIYEDVNANCKFDNLDQPLAGYKVMTDSNKYIGITDAEGIYFLPVAKGSYNLHCNYKPFAYSVNCPNSNTITVNYNADSIFEGNDFGISRNPNYYDIQTNFSVGSSRFRRGQNSIFTVYYNNLGNKTAHNFKLYIPLPKDLDLKIGNALYAKGGDTAVISIDSLLYRHWGAKAFSIYVDPNKFKAKDKVCFKVYTDSNCLALDSVKSNNSFSNCFIIDAPYDPNEKLVNGGSTKTALDKFIDYTIHFQNTGTDTAFRVVVTDTINRTFLDLSQFEMNWSDAPCETAIVGNVIYFTFDNIRLPHLATSGDGSIAGFSFRLGLFSNVSRETKFANRASIYFDFEDPILTKDAITEIKSPFIIQSLFKDKLCQEEANQIHFTSLVNIEPGNKYYLEISDANGNFDNAIAIREKSSVLNNDSFIFFTPKYMNGDYLFRIRSSSPAAHSISDSGQIAFRALSKPDFLINTNINNQELCENDTLRMDLVGVKYKYKVIKNNTALSNFNTDLSYRFKLNLADKFTVVAMDSVNQCTDTTNIGLSIKPRPNISLQINNPKASWCAGDTLKLQASGASNYSFYDAANIIGTYSSQSNVSEILTQSADVWTYGVAANACHNTSDTIHVKVNPLPAKPSIMSNKNTLSLPYYPQIIWYFNDIQSSDTGNTIANAASGKYQVKIIDKNTCSNLSDPYTHFNTSISKSGFEGFSIYPNPADQKLTITCPQSPAGFNIEIFNISGQLVLKMSSNTDIFNVDISSLESGLYKVIITGESGAIIPSLISVVR